MTYWGLNMVDEKKETSENLFSEDKIKEIVVAHERYRRYGQSIATIIIIFSSAIIAWAIKKDGDLILHSQSLKFYLILCPIILSLVLGVLSQAFIYGGYLLEARDMVKALRKKQFKKYEWANLVTQGTNKLKNNLFFLADIGSFLCVGIFVFAIVSLGIYLIP